MANGTVESSTVKLSGVNLSGSQTAKLKYDVPPKDILVFVPGTTDPVNSTPAQHAANASYWQGKDDYMLARVKQLKSEYLDLHIMHEEFSWSGDNSKSEREKAGNGLRELLYARKKDQKHGDALYKGFVNKAVSLHLIGHSHGGNVINEFTKAIKAKGDFPKLWKIKSITYLSTPFFTKMHQADTSHFHPQCRIINVFNKYDLTQRVIADYTMQQLPLMLEHIKGDRNFALMQRGIRAIDTDALRHLAGLKRIFGNLDDTTEGPQLWGAMASILEVARAGMRGAIAVAAKLHAEFPDVVSARAKEIVTNLAESLKRWATTAETRFRARLSSPAGWLENKYHRAAFLDDLDIGTLFQVLNAFLAFNPATLTGQLFDLIDALIIGQIDRFDDTKTTPKHQIKGFPIIDVPIHKYDKYFNQREAQWAVFISRLEATQRQYHGSPSHRLRMDFLLQLLAQFEYAKIGEVIDGLGTLDWIVNDWRATHLKALRQTLINLRAELDRRACGIVVPADIAAGKSILEQRGGIAYTAMVSHGLSHMDLYDEV
ncbi:MAG: hypothetical protein L6Q76_13960, partial [Polyangiaceae bacterium]|nr:hypothetical protein [Polyangiaceae bacterium]